MAWNFERVAGPFNGPIGGLAWNGQRLFFSVVSESRILSLDGGSGRVREERRYTGRTSGIGFGPRGELYGCQEGSRRIIEFVADGSARITASTLEGRYHNFPSDLSVDRAGRVWFCDAAHPLPAIGPQIFPPLDHFSVLRLARGANHRWRIKRMTFDTEAPRALLVSKDEKVLFVAHGDTSPRHGARELRAYPIEGDDSLGRPAVLLTFGEDHRGPHRGVEGMCLDGEGNIVACAGWRRSGPGPCVHVVSPEGMILDSHPLPDDVPTRCAFGGEGLRELFVGTATGNLYRASAGGRTGFNRFA